MDEPSNDYSELCRAVGSLILAFANLENAISAGLRLHLMFRLKKHKKADALTLAGAVYGSMRLRVSQGIMRRLMVEEGATPRTLKIFDDLFAHVGHINTFRDKLAHQSLNGTDRPRHWTVSDLLTTRSMNKALEYEFSTDLVFDAQSDLIKAWNIQKEFLPHPGIRVKVPRELPAWRYNHLG